MPSSYSASSSEVSIFEIKRYVGPSVSHTHYIVGFKEDIDLPYIFQQYRKIKAIDKIGFDIEAGCDTYHIAFHNKMSYKQVREIFPLDYIVHKPVFSYSRVLVFKRPDGLYEEFFV